jgi:hypothetical protein
VSPLRSIKTSRSSTSPTVRVTHENPSDHDEVLNLLQVDTSHHIFNTIATGDRAILKNIRPTTLTVSSAFGKSAQPTEMGDLQPHVISTVLIDATKNTILFSVSHMCGQKIPLCDIFSPVDCRFFPFHHMLPYLRLVSENCDESAGRTWSLIDFIGRKASWSQAINIRLYATTCIESSGILVKKGCSGIESTQSALSIPR